MLQCGVVMIIVLVQKADCNLEACKRQRELQDWFHHCVPLQEIRVEFDLTQLEIHRWVYTHTFFIPQPCPFLRSFLRNANFCAGLLYKLWMPDNLKGWIRAFLSPGGSKLVPRLLSERLFQIYFFRFGW